MPKSETGRILPDSMPGCVIWRVEDFFSHPLDRVDYCIESPYFSAMGHDWWLEIHPYVNIIGNSYTRLCLWKSPSFSPAFVRFEFGICERGGGKRVFSSGKAEDGLFWYEDLPALLKMEWEELAPGGVLSVFCSLHKRGETLWPSATPGNDTSTQTEDFGQVSQDYVDGPSKTLNSRGALKLLENLKELLSSEETCDVTLKVQNQEFKAHKALLVARSSVFKAMFCHEMSEKLSNEVHISDCDPDAFGIFLKHTYTGDAEGLSMSNAFNVFFIANKYDATELMIQCKEYIARNITVETVCDVIAFSLLHDDSVLLEMASKCFTKHFGQILLTNKWQCFLRDHTTAANELLIRASKCYSLNSLE